MHVSIWEKESFYAHSDVIIAGSGFVGLWSAYYLKNLHPSLKITIVDSGSIPTGASTRNAGFACFGSVTELVRDTLLMGEEDMLTLVEMRYRGLSRIRKVFRKKEIDYSNCGGYELIPSFDDDRYRELPYHVKWLNNALEKIVKSKKTFRFVNDSITAFAFSDVSQVIYNELEGCLHPGKLCMALLHKVQGMGVNVIASTKITHFESDTNGVTLFTNKNIQLTADKLLVCTNAFAKQLLPQLDIVPARGQILVTAPIPSLKIKGTFHYDEGYYYFRNVGNRLLIGGARNSAIEQETTVTMDITDNIQKTLELFVARHLLPGIPFEITDRWSGIMGLGGEKMPIIKKISPGIYCAVRMSGMGVALAPVAGEMVAELICN